jgi:hypothetical protein
LAHWFTPPPQNNIKQKTLYTRMKFSFSILTIYTLIFAFTAMPSMSAFACGKSGSCGNNETQENTTPQKSCCAEEQAQPCGDEKDCAGDCGGKGCQCASSFTHVPLLLHSIENPISPVAFLPKKAIWYYLNKIPNAVYLSIWLPPKINA